MDSSGSTSQASWCCTGVMIADDLFLTNWHCGAPDESFPADLYWNEDIRGDAVVDLSWDDSKVSDLRRWLPDREYSVGEIVSESPALDFVLLRVRPASNDSQYARPTIVRKDRAHLGENPYCNLLSGLYAEASER